MAYRTEATRVEDNECPLCRIVVGKPRRAFVKHVGRHMEEIALMALPRDVEEDSEEGSVSTERTHTCSLETWTPAYETPGYGSSRQYYEHDLNSINLRQVDAHGPPSLDYPMVILLSLFSVEQSFPSICAFCYALRWQLLKLWFSSQLHLIG